MLTLDDALARLDHVLKAARTAGADAADALYSGEASTSVSVRLGRLEDVGRSEGEELGLRVFVGARTANVVTSDLSASALVAAAERAVAMARLAPEDRFAGLAPEDRLQRGPLPELELEDACRLSPEQLQALATEAEAAALGVAGVTNSEGGGAAAGEALMALATSHGFAAGKASTSFSLSASVIAGEGAEMQRDHGWHAARHLADLETPAEIGERAGTRAVARLRPVKLATATLPVVFDPRVSASLLGHFVQAITGASVARGTSFLKDRLGAAVFGPGVSIIDDPLRRRGLRSRAFDGEGLATQTVALVENGVLTRWLLDVASARQLGLAPNGHAVRGVGGPPGAGPSNLHLEAGTTSRADLIGGIRRGVLVTELIGMGVNGLTGDYSRGASGFLIEDGEVTRPVAEITIAGNLKEMFARMVPADDLRFRHASNAPTILIDAMTVAGA